jgi:hypothetical protein
MKSIPWERAMPVLPIDNTRQPPPFDALIPGTAA